MSQSMPPALQYTSRTSRLRDLLARALLVGAATTLAGLLATEFRHVEIVNLRHNGARLAHAVTQCESIAAGGDVFDLVLLFVGGNAGIRFTSLRQMVQDAHALLVQAKRLSTTVVCMGSANIGAFHC
jgi:hypothetical protein